MCFITTSLGSGVRLLLTLSAYALIDGIGFRIQSADDDGGAPLISV